MKKSCLGIITQTALIKEKNIFTNRPKINHALGIITGRILGSLHII